jgi:Secretion system C-terminal sorting domain
MKWLLHYGVCTMLFSFSSAAQQLNPSVINSTSKSDSIQTASGTILVDWSVGELPLVTTLSGTNVFITNGFLQPGLLAFPTSIATVQFSSSQVRIFPNPAQSLLQLEFRIGLPGKINIVIFDVTGRKLEGYSFQYTGGLQTNQLNMKDYAAGAYQLYLYYQSGGTSRVTRTGVFKVLKF